MPLVFSSKSLSHILSRINAFIQILNSFFITQDEAVCMAYLGGLCSCNWRVLPGWRWFQRSSCLRWLSTTPQPREWIGTGGPETSALGTGHLKHKHQQITEWNRWACWSTYKHTWVREVSLWLSAANENNSKYWNCHSSPNRLLNHDRGGLFMWVIWAMPDCFWNSISTGTDHGIPLLPQKWPQVCLLGRSYILHPPYHAALHVEEVPLDKHVTASERDSDLGNICLCKNSIKHANKLWEPFRQKPQGF